MVSRWGGTLIAFYSFDKWPTGPAPNLGLIRLDFQFDSFVNLRLFVFQVPTFDDNGGRPPGFQADALHPDAYHRGADRNATQNKKPGPY